MCQDWCMLFLLPSSSLWPLSWPAHCFSQPLFLSLFPLICCYCPSTAIPIHLFSLFLAVSFPLPPLLLLVIPWLFFYFQNTSVQKSLSKAACYPDQLHAWKCLYIEHFTHFYFLLTWHQDLLMFRSTWSVTDLVQMYVHGL